MLIKYWPFRTWFSRARFFHLSQIEDEVFLVSVNNKNVNLKSENLSRAADLLLLLLLNQFFNDLFLRMKKPTFFLFFFSSDLCLQWHFNGPFSKSEAIDGQTCFRLQRQTYILIYIFTVAVVVVEKTPTKNWDFFILWFRFFFQPSCYFFPMVSGKW